MLAGKLDNYLLVCHIDVNSEYSHCQPLTNLCQSCHYFQKHTVKTAFIT